MVIKTQDVVTKIRFSDVQIISEGGKTSQIIPGQKISTISQKGTTEPEFIRLQQELSAQGIRSTTGTDRFGNINKLTVKLQPISKELIRRPTAPPRPLTRVEAIRAREIKPITTAFTPQLGRPEVTPRRKITLAEASRQLGGLLQAAQKTREAKLRQLQRDLELGKTITLKPRKPPPPTRPRLVRPAVQKTITPQLFAKQKQQLDTDFRKLLPNIVVSQKDLNSLTAGGVTGAIIDTALRAARKASKIPVIGKAFKTINPIFAIVVGTELAAAGLTIAEQAAASNIITKQILTEVTDPTSPFFRPSIRFGLEQARPIGKRVIAEVKEDPLFFAGVTAGSIASAQAAKGLSKLSTQFREKKSLDKLTAQQVLQQLKTETETALLQLPRESKLETQFIRKIETDLATKIQTDLESKRFAARIELAIGKPTAEGFQIEQTIGVVKKTPTFQKIKAQVFKQQITPEQAAIKITRKVKLGEDVFSGGKFGQQQRRILTARLEADLITISKQGQLKQETFFNQVAQAVEKDTQFKEFKETVTADLIELPILFTEAEIPKTGRFLEIGEPFKFKPATKKQQTSLNRLIQNTINEIEIQEITAKQTQTLTTQVGKGLLQKQKTIKAVRQKTKKALTPTIVKIRPQAKLKTSTTKALKQIQTQAKQQQKTKATQKKQTQQIQTIQTDIQKQTQRRKTETNQQKKQIQQLTKKTTQALRRAQPTLTQIQSLRRITTSALRPRKPRVAGLAPTRARRPTKLEKEKQAREKKKRKKRLAKFQTSVTALLRKEFTTKERKAIVSAFDIRALKKPNGTKRTTKKRKKNR